MDRNKLIDNFIKLAKIPSPSGNEGAAMTVLMSIIEKEDLGKMTFDSSMMWTRANINNLMVESANYSPEKGTILISAHIDTVPVNKNVISPMINGDVIRSDGSTILGADDKAGVVVCLEILRAVKSMTNPPRVIALFFVSEENGLLGSKYFNYSLLGEKPWLGALVFDGESPNELYTKYSSNWRYKIEVIGKSAHAGMNPEQGINACQLASKIIQKIDDLKLTGKFLFQNKHLITHNFPAFIEGGDAWNKIPEKCIISAEVRSFQPGISVSFINHILAQIKDIPHELEMPRCDEPVIINTNNNFYLSLLKVMELLGVRVKTLSAMGRADACNIFEKTSMPAITIGCGIRKEHSKEEYAIISEMVKAAEIGIKLIESF